MIVKGGMIFSGKKDLIKVNRHRFLRWMMDCYSIPPLWKWIFTTENGFGYCQWMSSQGRARLLGRAEQWGQGAWGSSQEEGACHMKTFLHSHKCYKPATRNRVNKPLEDFKPFFRTCTATILLSHDSLALASCEVFLTLHVNATTPCL